MAAKACSYWPNRRVASKILCQNCVYNRYPCKIARERERARTQALNTMTNLAIRVVGLLQGQIGEAHQDGELLSLLKQVHHAHVVGH